ncbi:mannitol dehydrogenase family protein [Sphingomonas sp. PL-96]|uniref:mannitol dehydrogenase family protein n=1 Tax=Sphingomonas sp. PL-96 TaxID=2887201 RepID=UPI001E3CB425|nr:mannitol dehydrogenase family protein [Sphingomonas sp. PL-96]MCC2978409.1 mannitol dehydrogenase family protein [Sphingomonas sp. PL-96]
MSARLSNATLAALPSKVARPAYDRSAVKPGVVHLGIGAFHRAHQAAVFEAALAAGDLRWGIIGVSLRSASVRNQLVPQDGLYTLVEREGDRRRLQVMGAVQTVLVAPENPGAVVAALASPDTHLVTLTITEKGYKLDPATGQLIEADADVAADLASLDAPRTAPGFLVAALARRRAAGLAPFTAISCDNLPHNGARLAQAVQRMAAAHDPDLAAWIEAEGAFPQTMVDRIVPATTDADVADLAATLGVEDQAMVKTEPFTQWVIEDRFAGPRPDFAALGVQLTDDVAPWEEAKLRLLNGAHSGIAYLGGLAGIDFVHEVVALPEGRRFVERLWDEAQATLSPPPGLDVAAYRAQLMIRFANPALQHRTRQIAMDGSQKLPQRLLATIAARRAIGARCPALKLAVAAWMRWQAGMNDHGDVFAVDDPLAARTAAAVQNADTAEHKVAALLAIDAIFPPALAQDTGLAQMLAAWLHRLEAEGARATLARL